MRNLFAALTQALLPLAITAVTWISWRVRRLISSRIRSEEVKSSILLLNEATMSVVREVFQSIVDTLKAKGGKLTEEQAKAAKDMALQKLKLQLGKKGLEEIMKAFGLKAEDLSWFLGTKIEAAVHEIKALSKKRA